MPRKPLSRRAHAAPILLALALAAGSLDAISYLSVGVFPANMTGNTVLLAVSAARGNGIRVAYSATALGGFAVGVALAVVLMPRGGGRWPRSAAPALIAEACALLALTIYWVGAGIAGARYELIVLAAATMGAQSAAVRASDIRGVATTYMTGTYMNAVARAFERLRGAEPSRAAAAGLPGATWITYAIGALVGAVAEKAWHGNAVVFALAIVALVGAVASRSSREED